MATTFDTTNFKNPILNWLSGSSLTAAGLLYYCNFYNGAQAASPTTTPVGSLEFATVSQGLNLSSNKWSAADNNATAFLSVPVSATTPAGAAAVSTLTTARFYTSGQVGTVDTPLGVASGTGIGAVVDSLTSTAGVGNVLNQAPFKLPLNNGSTLWLSLTLAQRLVDLTSGVQSAAAANVPQMGINTNGGCTITVYSGIAPATADAPLGSATALCSFTVGATQLWGAASGGSLPMAISLTSAAAVATGTAAFARMVKTNGSMTYTIQGSTGTTGSDFVIGTTAITTGSTYTLTDCVINL